VLQTHVVGNAKSISDLKNNLVRNKNLHLNKLDDTV